MTYEEKSHVKSDVSEILVESGYKEISPGLWKSQSASDVAKILKRSETEAEIGFLFYWIPIAIFLIGLGLYIWLWKHT